MGFLAPVIGLVGTIASASAAQSAGDAQYAAEQVNAENARRAAAYEAAQLRFQGQSELASSQRTMEQTRLKTTALQSHLISSAAASGAGATDPTVLNVSGQVEKQGELAALTDLWGGLNRQRGLENQAKATIYQGDINAANSIQKGEAARAAAEAQSTGTILSGFGGLFKGFGNFKDAFGNFG